MNNKPVIGISCGDINGIGPEIILKTLSDARVVEFCTPVVFANNKVLNFYRKSTGELNISAEIIKDFGKLHPTRVNIFSCWEEEVAVQPGQMTDTGGRYARISLNAAAASLKDNSIEGLVTAPFHKSNIQHESFRYTGHTPWLKETFNAKEVAMLMVGADMRIALLTEHVPIKDVASHITKDAIRSKLHVLYESLKKDFGIDKPRIAVLGLNPHAGDEGLVGKEEKEIIAPAIEDLKQRGMLCFGPFSADAFFAQGHYRQFDAVLALYHDQGLIPFKSLAMGEGVNFTAGLDIVRTSPDHGTAFDIAGKGIADEASFREALFTAVDIVNMRKEIREQHANPLKRRSAAMMKNSRDEKIDE